MGDMGLLAITAYVYQSVRGIVLQFPCPFLYFKPFIREIDEQQNFLSMKKTYFKFLNALVILCVSLSLASCSDDDDDGNGSGTENLLVGKWELVEANFGGASKTITFNKDNTGLDGNDPMKWTMKENNLTIMLDEKGTLPATFMVLSLTQNDLSLQWGGYQLKYKRVN